MNREETQRKLEKEVEEGKKAKQAYDIFMSNYVKEKVLTLFENFCDSQTMDPEALKDYRRMASLLKDMEREILTIVETGKLAQQSLNDLEKENG